MDIIFGDGAGVKTSINTNGSHIKVIPELNDRVILILGSNRVVVEYTGSWVITTSMNVDVKQVPPEVPHTLIDLSTDEAWTAWQDEDAQ